MKLPKRHDEEPPEYPLLPEEVYVAELAEYSQPKESAYVDKRTGKYPMQIRLVFAVKDPEVEDKWQGEKAGAYFDLEMNSLLQKSIYHPLYALDPKNEPEGGEDLDEYLGKKCRISVKHKKNGDKTYANVDKVMPLRRRAKADESEDEAPKRKPSAFDVDSEAA